MISTVVDVRRLRVVDDDSGHERVIQSAGIQQNHIEWRTVQFVKLHGGQIVRELLAVFFGRKNRKPALNA